MCALSFLKNFVVLGGPEFENLGTMEFFVNIQATVTFGFACQLLIPRYIDPPYANFVNAPGGYTQNL